MGRTCTSVFAIRVPDRMVDQIFQKLT